MQFTATTGDGRIIKKVVHTIHSNHKQWQNKRKTQCTATKTQWQNKRKMVAHTIHSNQNAVAK